MTTMDIARLEPTKVSTSGEPNIAGPPARSLHALLALAAALLVVAALLASADQNRDSVAAVAPPPLPQIEAPCVATLDAAGEQASRAERSALARIDRYPFAPADGLAALQLLDRARHCYLASGDAAGQARVALRAKLWRGRLERDYRDHLTRYKRALSAERPLLALRDIAFLLELWSGHDGPFLAQLRQAQRELEAAPQSGGRP
jgi:hypothetical protein